ncbi:MAG: ATP-binding protein [Candidatus Magasanikbacteria bacterium]
MKITIIGTHSTGKTTIIEQLKNTLQIHGKEVFVIQELARECPLPINETTTLEAQKWILENQIQRENEIDHTNRILITDRSSLDNFAYMYRALGENTPEPFEKLAVEHMSTYDFIFKTQKLDIDATRDKVRSTDYEFRDTMDWLIYHLLEKHTVPYYLLRTSTDVNLHVQDICKTICQKTQDEHICLLHQTSLL